MAVETTLKDKIVVILIALSIIGFMGIIAVLASCNFFERFVIDRCAEGCLFVDWEAC